MDTDFAAIVALAVVMMILVLIIIIICLWINQSPNNYRNTNPNYDIEPPSNILPPVYYTEQLEDPLLQNDLRDHYRKPSEEI